MVETLAKYEQTPKYTLWRVLPGLERCAYAAPQFRRRLEAERPGAATRPGASQPTASEALGLVA